jgi:hypothetical protein
MKYVELTIAAALCLASAPAATEEAQSFPKEQIAAGAELYSVNCSPDPSAAFNLRLWRASAEHQADGAHAPPSPLPRRINATVTGKVAL